MLKNDICEHLATHEMETIKNMPFAGVAIRNIHFFFLLLKLKALSEAGAYI